MTRTTTLIMFALAAAVWVLLMSIPFPERDEKAEPQQRKPATSEYGIPPAEQKEEQDATMAPVFHPEPQAPEREGWEVREIGNHDLEKFTHDWDGDGHNETLQAEFLGAGAQSHYDIVLTDGRTGAEIYRGYAFNVPRFGICTWEDAPSPVIFIKVLADLNAIVECAPDKVPYPAPDAHAGTATLLCYSYYRLISFRDGSWADVSGEYPGILWAYTSEGSLGGLDDYDRDDPDELVAIRLAELAYYKVRTGRPVGRDRLQRELSGADDGTIDLILAEVERLSAGDGNLAKFWKLERQAVIDQNP